MTAKNGPPKDQLSRRERQIMDIVYRLGDASVADVAERIPDRPAYNSVRMTLSILEKKGFLRHRREGQRYVYLPTVPQKKARRSAVKHLLDTFFGGSPSRAILTLLDMSHDRISDTDRQEIMEWLQDHDSNSP